MSPTDVDRISERCIKFLENSQRSITPLRRQVVVRIVTVEPPPSWDHQHYKSAPEQLISIKNVGNLTDLVAEALFRVVLEKLTPFCFGRGRLDKAFLAGSARYVLGSLSNGAAHGPHRWATWGIVHGTEIVDRM